MKIYLFALILTGWAQHVIANDRGIEPEVFQREYILTSGSIHKEVQTYGVNTCVALYLYDENGVAIVAHLDASTKVKKEIPNLLKNLGSNITAKVYGGVPGASINLFGQVVDTLTYYGVPIAEQKQNENDRESMSLSFNLITNEVEHYEEMSSRTKFNVLEAKIKRLHIGTKRLYRHEDSLGGGDIVNVQEIARDLFIPKMPF